MFWRGFEKAARQFNSDGRTLLSRVQNDPLDDDLVEQTVADSSEPIALAAAARKDAPPGLLVDLSQNRSGRVRDAVARHVNTPKMTRDRLSR